MAKFVLIVDDNAFLRKTPCSIFQTRRGSLICVVRQKMDVTPSRRLSNCAPDLIILDLSMPVMNGLDAARVLRRLLPSIPLIMYSAPR